MSETSEDPSQNYSTSGEELSFQVEKSAVPIHPDDNDAKNMMDNNNYGALQNEPEAAGKRPQQQRFDILEPSYERQSQCCHSNTDGFKIIVISMFVFAVGVTVALIITIASEPAPEVHYADVVTSDNVNCSLAGQFVLQEGGNAIDAAITTTFCLALVQPHITGIGGGGLMLIHSHRKNTSTVVDFREVAPQNARNDRYIQNPLSASFGRKSVGVPGFVKGLEHAFQKYGSGHIGLTCCSWTDLIRKAITEALRSVQVSDHFLNATQTKISQSELDSPDATLLKQLVESAQLGKRLTDIPIFMSLVKTLKSIAVNGSASIYEGGEVGQSIIKALGGAITVEDLANYTVKERTPLTTMIGQHEVMVSPSPSSGPELLALLNSFSYLKEQLKSSFGVVTADYLHSLANVLQNLEDLQLGLGDADANADQDKKQENMLDKSNAPQWTSDIQKENVFDPSYALSDPVASNVAVMDKKDNYVSVVTSLNTWFGSKVMTSSGILLNNAIANFAIPNESGELETFNQLAEGRRPLTSNVVALSMDTRDICGTRIVTGGATASSVGQVLAFPLLLNSDLRSSVDAARIDVQNSTVFLENTDVRGSFTAKVVSDFLQREDDVNFMKIPFTPVNALEKTIDQPISIDDSRSGGSDSDEHFF